MPELPEVERARRQVESCALGRTIEWVECADDDIVLCGRNGAEVEKLLTGRRVEGVERRGKYLWMVLDRRPWPLFHLGMTGAFRTPGVAPLPLASSPRKVGTEWPPRFTKIRLRLSDGGELVMTNKRRLGRIRLLENPPAEPPVSALGFDPWLDSLTEEEFGQRLARRKAQLKGLLLHQGFVAGVGNWIADEVLYQARIDPRRRANELSSEETARLFRALRQVIATAVGVDAEKERLPADWLFHRRWGRPEGAVTVTGEPIEVTTLAGRSTAWVPSVQR